jgi:hypothetical protein
MFGLEVTVKCFAQTESNNVHLLNISGPKLEENRPRKTRTNVFRICAGIINYSLGMVGCANTAKIQQPVVLYSMPQNQDIYSIIVSSLQIRIRDPVPF